LQLKSLKVRPYLVILNSIPVLAGINFISLLPFKREVFSQTSSRAAGAAIQKNHLNSLFLAFCHLRFARLLPLRIAMIFGSNSYLINKKGR